MTPESSPEPQRRNQPLSRPETAQKKSDPLLHTILDKNYRIQATPLTAARRNRSGRKPGSVVQASKRAQDSALDSSPLAPPELHAEFLNSPVRRELTQTLRQQKTPGNSALTPAQGRDAGGRAQLDVWDSDEEDENLNEATGMPYGMSPPKTMQFRPAPSRLLRTPAREASKQIVDSILASAGLNRNVDDGGGSDDFDIDLDLDYDEQDMDMNSPSVVRKAPLEDDTF